ncbi:MAG: cytochrome b/b6 domain-containing protein [Pseudomonadota bacterium]
MVQLNNSGTSYGLVSMAFHWVTVLIVATQFAYGFTFVVLEDRRVGVFDSLVESLGILLIPITIARIAWIIHSGRPALPPTVTAVQSRAARLVQVLIYGMILTCATTGFMVRDQDMFFYSIPIPDVLNFTDSPLVNTIHDTGVYILLFLLAAHIGAAVLHIYLRDGVVKMMTSLR